MSHDEAVTELAAVALDAIPADVASAVRAHAAVCPECGPELAGMEEAVAALGELVPSTPMSPGRSAGIRSRLLVRARAERESLSAPVPGPPDLTRGVASLTGLGQRGTPGQQRAVSGESKRLTPATPMRQIPVIEPPSRSAVWYAIAATIALVAAGAQLMRVTSDRNAMRARIAAMDTVAPRADSLTAIVSQKDSMIAAMTGQDVMVVPLGNQGPEQQPLGRMIWNRASNDWIMVTHGLKQPRQGMTYQVWLVTDDAKISAGTFQPDKDGKTMMRAHYVLPRDALRAVAVTEEPMGGVPAPTGPMVISGSA